MTDKERDAAAAEGADGGVDDEELEDEDEFEDEDVDDEDAVVAPSSPSHAATAVPAAAGRRLRGQPRTVAAPLTASERAVKVDDRFSGWFVIAVVAVFALIFLNAIFLGHSGFVGGLFATPTPAVTASPSLSPSSVAPSSVPSSSAGPSSSASAGASSSAGASPSPSAAAPSPSARASSAPSPSAS